MVAETIGYFAPGMPKIGARRRVANSQKPAIGAPFCERRGHFLRAPDCLAGDAALIAPVSTQIPLLSGNFTGNFAILAPQKPISLHETAVLQRLCEQFPTQISRENIFEEQGIFSR
jgi:hypothetical protein